MTDAFKNFARRADQHPTHPPIGYQATGCDRDYPAAAAHCERPEVDCDSGQHVTIMQDTENPTAWVAAKATWSVER